MLTPMLRSLAPALADKRSANDNRTARCSCCHGRDAVKMWAVRRGDWPLLSDGRGGYMRGSGPVRFDVVPCRCRQ